MPSSPSILSRPEPCPTNNSGEPFAYTGEYRAPLSGEWYMNLASNRPTISSGGYRPSDPVDRRWICVRIESVKPKAKLTKPTKPKAKSKAKPAGTNPDSFPPFPSARLLGKRKVFGFGIPKAGDHYVSNDGRNIFPCDSSIETNRFFWRGRRWLVRSK